MRARAILHHLTHLPEALLIQFVSGIPGPTGDAVRYQYWKRRLGTLGRGARISAGASFVNPQCIHLGERCWIDRNVKIIAGADQSDRIVHVRSLSTDPEVSPGQVIVGGKTHIGDSCFLLGTGGIRIGKNSGIAAGSKLYSFSHHYRNLSDRSDARQYLFTPLAPIEDQALVQGPIVLEDGTAVGTNGVVLPGTRLRRGTWLGSGMVASGEYPPQTLIYSQVSVQEKDLSHLNLEA